jgi:hypothetical protein
VDAAPHVTAAEPTTAHMTAAEPAAAHVAAAEPAVTAPSTVLRKHGRRGGQQDRRAPNS